MARLVAIAVAERFGYRIFFREFLIKGLATHGYNHNGRVWGVLHKSIFLLIEKRT